MVRARIYPRTPYLPANPVSHLPTNPVFNRGPHISPRTPYVDADPVLGVNAGESDRGGKDVWIWMLYMHLDAIYGSEGLGKDSGRVREGSGTARWQWTPYLAVDPAFSRGPRI